MTQQYVNTPIAVTLADPKGYSEGNSLPVMIGDVINLDAFGRLRTSQPQSIMAMTFEYDTCPLLTQTVNVGAGTSTKTSNVSSVTLNTGGTTSGDGTAFQTKRYVLYQPGKSQLITMTGVIGAAKANVRSQIGYYDSNNGVFFDQNNGIGVTVRTSTSGAAVDTAVLQANWNLDKMDSTGTSGIKLDFTKEQIFVIDMQWLGAGRIRFGFQVAGSLVYCHQVLNANVITLPWSNTASLPARWEIHNTGTAASGTTMTAQCVSVISEGGQDGGPSLHFTASTGVTSLTATTTRAAALSIRPKTTFAGITNRAQISLEEVMVLAESGSIFWELIYNPTLGGSPSWASVNTNSAVEFDTAGTTVTGGTRIACGFASGGGDTARGNDTRGLAGLIPITLDAAGVTADIVTLCVTAFTGTVSVNASIHWMEQR
jgi:hypothetical protein